MHRGSEALLGASVRVGGGSAAKCFSGSAEGGIAYLPLLAADLREQRTFPDSVRPFADVAEAINIRGDAKAEGENVVLGAWKVPSTCMFKDAAWFGLELTRKNAPWVYAAGEPFRVIAALELYQVLAATIVFDLRGTDEGAFQLAGETNNLGNAFVVARMLTTRFPLSALLMEIALQLRARGLALDLKWILRAQNMEADAITNADFISTLISGSRARRGVGREVHFAARPSQIWRRTGTV